MKCPCTLAFVLALSGPACGEGIAGPKLPAGRYDLRQLNGSPLPYDHEGLGCCIYLEGFLQLGGEAYRISLTARNRNNGLVFSLMEWGRHSVELPRLTFDPDSFAVQGFLLDTATVLPDSIRVAFGGEGPGSPDQFQALFVRED
jgi:hypothetical protein